MNNAEIIQLWKSYDNKLEQSLILHKKNAEDITRIKIRSFLSSMKPLKIFTILVGIIWVGFIDMLIVNLFTVASPFFLIAAIIQVLLTKLAIGIYLYQLVLIHEADLSAPILATQEKLSRLKSSTLWIARLLFLQLPVWTVFYWNDSMWNNSAGWYVLQIIITATFTYFAIWLFVNIRYENRNKKWFRMIFSGKEWDPVLKSMELLKQVEEYQAADTAERDKQ